MATDVTSDAPTATSTAPPAVATSCGVVSATIDPRIARSRARLLEATTELLVEGGPRAVTADAVAERSGVAKSTLYRHWSTSNDLMLDAIRSKMPDLPVPDPDLAFEPALRQVVSAAVATLAHPEWRRILPVLLSLQFVSPELADALEADREGKVALMADLLQRGVTEERLPPGLDPLMMLDVVLGPLVMAALNGRIDALGATADFVVDRMLASYGR